MKKLYVKKQLDLRNAEDIPDFEFKEFKRHEKLLLQACKDIKNMNAVTAQNIKNYILIFKIQFLWIPHRAVKTNTMNKYSWNIIRN